MIFREAKTYNVRRLTTTTDELGGEIEAWEDSGTIDAEIWPLRGNQSRGEMGVTEKSTHKAFSLGTFESNTRLVDEVNTYLVGYVQDWVSHREAVLEHVPD